MMSAKKYKLPEFEFMHV